MRVMVKSLWTTRQKFVKAKAKICEQRGRNLWKSRQKFVNNTAKVYESHGKSLWTMLQKFVKATAKVCEPRAKVYESHGKSLWKTRQNFIKITGKVCEDRDKSLQRLPQKFVNDKTKITAGDRGGSDSHGGSSAHFDCWTLITAFVPYRWNAAENYKYFSLRNHKSESHSHKGCLNKEAKKPNCAHCNGPRVASYKGCPECKNEAFRQHVVNKQKSYATAVGKNSYPTQIASDITIYSWATDKNL